MEKMEPSYTVGGNVNWYNHYGEQYGGSLKKLKIVLLYDSASLVAQSVKNPLANVGDCLQCRRSEFDPWVGKIPWRRKWQLQFSFLGNPMERGAW